MLVVNDDKPEVGTKVLVKYGKKKVALPSSKQKVLQGLIFIRIIKFSVMTIQQRFFCLRGGGILSPFFFGCGDYYKNFITMTAI